MTVLIRKGHIVTATDDYVADIVCEGGRIRTIGLDIPAGGHAEVHDASGLLVFPGGVDVHTHLDWDFGVARTVDTFGTGTKAAAFGGTTTLVDFANQDGRALPAALEDWHGRAASAREGNRSEAIVLLLGCSSGYAKPAPPMLSVIHGSATSRRPRRFPWPGIGNVAKQGDGFRYLPMPMQMVP